MRPDRKHSGYQYLNNDFWKLCEDRKIYRLPQHLYIYLRGRYCKYGPEFDWCDAEIRRLLGVGKNTLIRAKKFLRERGLILYKNGAGKKWTHYTMLASVLLPDRTMVRGAKMEPLRCQNGTSEVPKMTLPIYRVTNKVKNKASAPLKKEKFKKYNPNSKQSLKHKNRLKELLGD